MIEKCICFKLNKEECMDALEKHANVNPVVTATGTACILDSSLKNPSPFNHFSRTGFIYISCMHMLQSIDIFITLCIYVAILFYHFM